MTEPSAQTVTLNGRPSQLAMPPCCANCGSTAEGRLPIEKVFRRDEGPEGGVHYVVTTAQVPFCATCVARHQAEVVTVSALRRVLLCFRQPVIIAALTTGGIALFFAPVALDSLTAGDGVGGLIFLGVVVVFALIAAASAYAAFDQSRRYAVPASTPVTSAFDYTDDESEMFDRQRRTYGLRNPTFAAAFEQANQHRQWDPRSARAMASHRGRTLLLIGVGVATVLMLVGTLLR